MRVKKMSVKNRVLAGVLAVIMLVSLLPAGVFAAGESTVVIAASDLQHDNGHTAAINSFNSIFAKVQGAYPAADGFLFAGDYDINYNSSSTGLANLKNSVSTAYPQMGEANMVFVQGNHDTASTVGLSDSGANDPASGKYGVFVINEDDYGWGSGDLGKTENEVKATAAALKSYLTAKRTAGFTAPIFVISHIPLHYSMRTKEGDGQYANYIFDELNAAGNAGLNIIFLFGHDHSNGWDDYLGGSAIYLAKGDKINIAQASKTTFKEETLAFTYMNAGYVGYYRNVNTGSETDLTMTAFEITDTQVTVNRYSTAGVHDLKSKGVTNSYQSETGYSPNTTVYNSPQTIALNKSIDTDPSEEIEKPVPGDGDGTATAKKLEQVYQLEEGVGYVIVCDQDDLVLTGSVSNNRLFLDGEPSVNTTDLWYYDDGYLRYGSSSGQYMTVASGSAGTTTSTGYNSNRVNNVFLNNDGMTFSIGRDAYYSTDYYLNQYNGVGNTGAAGYTSSGNSDAGSKWRFYKIVDNTVDTGLNGWVEITAPTTGGTVHTYTLATSITSGGQYAIVDDDTANALMNTENKLANKTVTISNDGKTLTANEALDLWTFSNTSTGTVYNGGRYLRYNNGFSLNNNSTSLTFAPVNQGQTFRITYRSYYGYGTTYYFGYTGSNWGGDNTQREVRLYTYTPTTEPGNPGLYYKISGNDSYPVSYGATEDDALAAVMAGITGYKYEASSTPASSVAGTAVEDDELTFTMSDSYDGTTPGEYAVTISKDGKTLGVVKVVVPAAPAYTVKDVTVSPSEGRVLLNCNPTTTATGSKLRVNLNDGEYYYLEDVTVGMLTHADGTPVDTTVAGVYENLVLTYVDIAGTTHTIQNYKLTVWAGNPYPEFPKEGSIRTNKTATGIDLRTTGVAAVELSVTGVPVKTGIDVVVIMDTSSSMNDSVEGSTQSRIAVANESLANLISKLKEPDADGQPRDIRIAVADFNGYYSSGRYALATDDHLTGTSVRGYGVDVGVYTGTKSTLDIKAFESVHNVGNIAMTTNSGTNYDYALDAAYQLAEASRADDPTRDLYVVFMSDGAPYQYNYFSSQSEASNWNNWLTGTYADLNAVDAATSSSYYYFYNGPGNPHRMAEAIKGDRNQMYTVIRKDANTTATAASHQQYMTQLPGLGATVYSIGFCLAADKQVTLDSIEYVIDSIATPSVENSYSYKVSTADALDAAFEKISSDIIYAATNARFVDEMSDSVDMQLTPFTTSSGEVINPTMEVVAYDIYTRSDFDAGRCAENEIGVRKGTKKDIEKVTFSSDGTAAYSDQLTGNILGTDGVIRAKSFFYNTTDTPVAITTQNDGTYMLPGETFYWNIGTVADAELALRYYVALTGAAAGELEAGNYPANKDATLYYTNYLGQENREKTALPPAVAWKSGSIHYAFYLVNEDGQIVTNQTTGETGSFANRVSVTSPIFYQEVKLNDKGDVGAIEVASADVLPEGYSLYDETVVYEVGVKGDTTGRWDITYDAGKVQSTYVTGFSGESYSNVAHTASTTQAYANYDYTHTTVWFAVKWEIKSVPDKVVVDYGLPVDIHVLGNDMFGDNGELVAIAPVSAKPNDNITNTSTLVDGFDDELTLTYGNAVVRDNVIRYTPGAMAMGAAEQLAYAVRYNGTANSGYYYGTLDIIPATSIYYEDSFVTFTNGTGAAWEDLGSAAGNALQDEDRPGKFSLATYDANNLYGTDSVNEGRLTYSLGSARTVTVDLDDSASSPTASFTFTGSGFDIIGLTSTETGFVQAEVFAVNNGVVAQTPTTKLTLDTYYNNGTLYQVPIITSGDGLSYGTWKVVLTPIYVPMLNHALLNNETNPSTLDALLAGSYTFVMDAVRIYDPANHLRGNPSELIRSAYVADNEGWPSYFELRTQLIQKQDFNALVDDSTKAPGIIFIEQNGTVPNNENGVAEYEKFGPNNEIYLAPGQAIAFFLGADRVDAGGDGKPSELGAAWDADNVASVQLGMKSADGNPVTVKVFDATTSGDSTPNRLLNTCTEMYYDITSLKDRIVVIANKGTSGLLSVTKVKVTHKAAPAQPGALAAPFVVSRAIAAEALAALNGDAGVFTPEKLELSLRNKTALEKGDKARLRIVASGDVSRVEVNGEQFTRFVEELGTGDHIWNIEKKMKKVGEYTFSVVAYNADGVASRTYELPVSVTGGK